MIYRLGLDIGATSIGWAVFDIEHNKLIDMGVRIFDDGREDKTKAALCVKRRNARGARRLVNRKHIKKHELLKKLIEFGLFPQDEESRQELKKLNPYELRKEALDRQVSLYELGRIIFNLAQRKGFQSNRKDNKEEGGKLKAGYEQLKEQMQNAGARTYGEYWRMKQEKNHNVTIRLKNTFDANGKYINGKEFPFREVYEEEFEKIWQSQKEYYPSILTDDRRKIIKEILFFQRPLKEQEEGYCSFEKGERRIAKAHPLFQEFRIWQHVLNLEYVPKNSSCYQSLSYEQIQQLVSLLKNPQGLKVTQKGLVSYTTIKKALGLDNHGRFNFEGMSRDADMEKGVLVDTTQNAINQSIYFKEFWNQMTESQKGKLIDVLSRPENYIPFPKTRLSIEESEKILKDYLCREFTLSEPAAEELLYKVNLEDDFASLSKKAVEKLLTLMKQGMRYPDACVELGYGKTLERDAQFDKLPYYGVLLEQSCLGKKINPETPEERYGKINNATVHVALNQIRYLVNELIDIYGKPYDIAIEYARDLPASAEERQKILRTQDNNEKENQRIIKEMCDKIGQREYNKRDIQKYKIWKQMGIPKNGKADIVRECPFSGKPISVSDLLNGQMFQIEHLLPFSRTLDDGINNKVISSVEANRYKGNRTPFEAFGESKDGYDWTGIQKRAQKLSYEQQWRFSADAMKKFEAQESPIARSLNDTRYMTRILQAYLLPIVREDGKKTVQSVVGKLTSMVRKAWGLNQYKNKENNKEYRAFHNHHAIDAVIVATMERGQISKVSEQLKKISACAKEEFKDELYKFKDPQVSKEEKDALRKRIKEFVLAKEEGIINQNLPCPENLDVARFINQVEKLNISHKPSLKNIRDNNSTIGQLHEDSAYGLKSFVDEESLKAKFICQKNTIEKDITEYIPMFYHKEDKNAYYDAYKNWFVLNGKARSMIASDKEEKQKKKELGGKERQAIMDLRHAAEKAFKWFVGGGNFCAEIYEINSQNKVSGVPTNNQGEWVGEIVSNYNATIRERRGENISYLPYKYPNARKIMRLRRNDMVLATFTREQTYADDFFKGIKDYVQNIFNQNPSLEQADVLFRVKKMSGGSVYFTPHNIAREDADTKSWKAAVSSMQKYRVRKVIVTPAGRIKHAQ